MEAFQVAEKSNKDLKAKLTEEERERKSAATTLESIEKQHESLHILLQKDKVEKAKKEAEKAQKEVQQEGYEIGVVETEDALRAEVPGVCRIYCDQVWNEALNQVEIEDSSALRRVENIYYSPAIRPSSSSSSQVIASLEVAESEKNGSSKVPPSSWQSSKNSRANWGE